MSAVSTEDAEYLETVLATVKTFPKMFGAQKHINFGNFSNITLMNFQNVFDKLPYSLSY